MRLMPLERWEEGQYLLRLADCPCKKARRVRLTKVRTYGTCIRVKHAAIGRVVPDSTASTGLFSLRFPGDPSTFHGIRRPLLPAADTMDASSDVESVDSSQMGGESSNSLWSSVLAQPARGEGCRFGFRESSTVY